MATKIYQEHPITFFDGTTVMISPLKIKYLHQVMEVFLSVKKAKNDLEAIAVMTECTRLAMQQYCPRLSHSIEELEDEIDLPIIYKILDIGAGIKIDQNKEEPVKDQATDNGDTWDSLDLLKLESEAFILGAWKNYEDLELSISMPELLQIISMRRELDHMEKKFLAAIQGVDIDKDKNDDAWEEMKNRVLYKGKGSNDITNLSGKRAMEAGFGIGNGLDYEEITA
jgi:hypothetical protein